MLPPDPIIAAYRAWTTIEDELAAAITTANQSGESPDDTAAEIEQISNHYGPLIDKAASALVDMPASTTEGIAVKLQFIRDQNHYDRSSLEGCALSGAIADLERLNKYTPSQLHDDERRELIATASATSGHPVDLLEVLTRGLDRRTHTAIITNLSTNLPPNSIHTTPPRPLIGGYQPPPA